MAGSVSLGYCMWLDGSTISAQIARVQDVSSSFASGGTTTAMATQAGVLPSVGLLKVIPSSGMNVVVQAGFAIIPNTTATSGAYKAGSMTSTTVTVATSDPTNPRIDLIVLTVTDLGTSGSSAYLQTITGTAAVSPVAPTAPAYSLILAQISVPATTSTITSGLITDKRVYTAAAGGVVPYSSASVAVGGYLGCVGYDASKDSFFHNNALGTTEPMRTLPWAPVYAVTGSTVTLTNGSTVNVLNANFTVDGNTDVKTTIKWPAAYLGTSGTGTWQFATSITMDSTQLDGMYFSVPSANSTAYTAGGMLIYSTSSATGDTPTAGTHTMHFQMFTAPIAGATGSGPALRATPSLQIYMRVEPVNL